jgi:hypothetical protein
LPAFSKFLRLGGQPSASRRRATRSALLTRLGQALRPHPHQASAGRAGVWSDALPLLAITLLGLPLTAVVKEAMSLALRAERPAVIFSDPTLIGSLSSNGSDPRGSVSEGQRPDPLDFTAEELRDLNRRFGVHGPQPRIAQLFTEGLDNLRPLRAHTLTRIEELRPVILAESQRHTINPMLVAAVLFDELQHAKPGEDTPIAAQSGLFSTHGPAQLSLGEMQKQGLLPAEASPAQIQQARLQLLDPNGNVKVLVGKFARLRLALGLPGNRILSASGSPRDAKALATLAYLHNGKLDYPGRVLRYMQDPELHAVIYGSRRPQTSPLI